MKIFSLIQSLPAVLQNKGSQCTFYSDNEEYLQISMVFNLDQNTVVMFSSLVAGMLLLHFLEFTRGPPDSSPT